MESLVLNEADASRRLLVAFAHPDDESFGPAGTIIHYASQGVDVHYVCATRGEAGEVEAQLLSGYSSLAELRTKELQCAAGHLRLAALHFLDYRDSGMENASDNQNPASLHQAPLEEVVEKVTRLIRQIRPQVVLTFEPTGGTFHPDHIKVSKATTLAFRAAAEPSRFPLQLEQGLEPFQPAKLYYTAFPRRWLGLAVRIMPLFGQDPAALGQNKDVNLRRMAEVEQTVTTKIRVSDYYEARRQAALCHASQGAGILGLAGFLGRWLFRYDSYARVVPPADGRGLERDLFAGIEDVPVVHG